MGTLGGGNGGNWPPDGGGPPDDLPDFPPEWGVIVIPDDAAELDPEAGRIRRELRREGRRARWRRRLHLPPRHPDAGTDESTIGVPMLVIAIAVLATLLSLFVVAWPAQPRGRGDQTVPTSSAASAGQPSAWSLPDLALAAADGSQLRLHDTLPAVVLLVDGCSCGDLIAQTAAAVAGTGAPIGVLTVARSAVPALPPGPRAWAATDPAGALYGAVTGASNAAPVGTNRATVLLVSAQGVVVKLLPVSGSVEDFRADLAKLG